VIVGECRSWARTAEPTRPVAPVRIMCTMRAVGCGFELC
jgi:hypothetical protein